ncbi:MAG: SDR family NAD(P)-dependent oxidoreductase [Gammaproteobacteria bacterium]|nr:SDR family NAD(P)-dependent oxidoreductase [Gammaproteobacteria bacterium]
MSDQRTAVVAGIGPGLGAALCRALVRDGYRVAGLARSATPGEALEEELGAGSFRAFQCGLTDAPAVQGVMAAVSEDLGTPAVYVHNAAAFHHQAFADTPPAVFEHLWRTTCLGAVHGAQATLPAMVAQGGGTLLLVGATASVKAAAGFSAFGAAKFALRGLAQSLAREYGPQGVHVAHVVIDGVMWGERARDDFAMTEDQCMDPTSVAATCLDIIRQPADCWTHELDLRPAGESF